MTLSRYSQKLQGFWEGQYCRSRRIQDGLPCGGVALDHWKIFKSGPFRDNAANTRGRRKKENDPKSWRIDRESGVAQPKRNGESKGEGDWESKWGLDRGAFGYLRRLHIPRYQWGARGWSHQRFGAWWSQQSYVIWIRVRWTEGKGKLGFLLRHNEV